MSANALMQIAFMGSRIVGPGDRRRDGRTLHAEGLLRDRRGQLPAVGGADRRRWRSSGRRRCAPPSRIVDQPHPRDLARHGRRACASSSTTRAILFFVIAMAAGLFTIGCFGPLISIYVRDTLHASAGLFGYVSGMVGVGLLARHADHPHHRAQGVRHRARAVGPARASAPASSCSAPCRTSRRRSRRPSRSGSRSPRSWCRRRR